MAPLLNPRTGLPLETFPDDVAPGDLQVAPSPLEAMDPASPAAQLAAAQVAAAQAPALTPEAPPPPLEAPPPAAAAPPPRPSAPKSAAGARPAAAPKPDAEAKARAAEKEAGKGALTVAENEQALSERKATAEQDQAAADQAAIKAHYDDVDRRTAAGMDYLQKQQDKAANFKVRDMYEGRTGAAIAAALMEGLGAFGAALTGGPNHAANVIERGRQDFRQKQLDQLEQLNRGVANAKERIDLTRMELASREAGMFKRLAADRLANMSRFGFDQARIEGDKIYQDLVGKQAEAERTWQSMLHTRGQAEKLQASEIVKNYAAAAKDRADAATGKYNKLTDPTLRNVTGPDGKVIFTARDPEQAEKANAHVAVVRDIISKAKELKAKVEQGWTVPGSDRGAEMEALQADLMSKVRVAEEMGALDKGSQTLAEKMIPTGMGFGRTGPARLDQFIKATRDSAVKKFDSFGVPGQKVVDYLDRADAGAAAGPKPSTTEYARAADAYRRAAPGSPDQVRLGRTLQAMRQAMGH
jgi:hypothetical protein